MSRARPAGPRLPVVVWYPQTAGQTGTAEHYDACAHTQVVQQDGYGPRGVWTRWSELEGVQLMADPVTPGTYQVHIVYRADGVTHKQLLGLITLTAGFWRPVSEPGGPARVPYGKTIRAAAEALARRTEPSYPGAAAGAADGG